MDKKLIEKLLAFANEATKLSCQQQGQIMAIMAFQISLAQTISKNSPELKDQLGTRLEELAPTFKTSEPYYSDIIDMFLGCLGRDPDLPPDKPLWFRGIIDGGLSKP